MNITQTNPQQRGAIIAPGGWVAIAALILIAIGWFLTARYNPAPPRSFAISTGGETGAYYAFAKRYQALLAREGVRMEILPSNGSIENYERLQAGKVSAGFVQSGIASAAQAPTLQALVGVAYEPVWVFYRGNASYERIGQLAGKRISIGPQGSGARKLAMELMQASGVAGSKLSDSMKLLDLAPDAAADALDKGEIDAALIVAGIDAPVVKRLLASPHRLMSFAQADAFTRLIPSLSKVTLPRGALDLINDKPSQDVVMVAATANLVVQEDFHPALAYLLLDAAYQTHPGASLLNAQREFPSLKGQDLPVSEESERYAKSGRPFLQRYVPFWLANFIERALVILIPVVGILLPLGQAIPAIQSFRVKRKLEHWYVELKALEKNIASGKAGNTTPERQALLKQIDAIEAGANRLSIPQSYYNDLYSLHASIDLVRARVIAKIPAANLPAG